MHCTAHIAKFFCLQRFPAYLQELHSNDWKQINQTQQHFKTPTCMRQPISYFLGLQPRGKATMLGVNAMEFFWKNLHEKRVSFAKERNAFVLDHHYDRHGRRHVQTINLQVFPFDIKLSLLVIFLYLVWFSLYFFFWELRKIVLVKILQFCS